MMMRKPEARFHQLLAGVVLILLMGSIATASSEFEITIDPIGHWHVFNAKTLKFTVSDTHDAMSAPDMNLQVQIARVGSDRITNRSVEASRPIKSVMKGTVSIRSSTLRHRSVATP
jgi:hypothetical protein